MQLGISEILKKVSSIEDENARKWALSAYHNNQAVMQILKLAFDPTVVFMLPPGEPPFRPSDQIDSHPVLYTSLRKMYLFIAPGNPSISKVKREMLFINMLETLDPEDAKLMVAVKDKKLPYENLDYKFVSEVFPGFLPDESFRPQTNPYQETQEEVQVRRKPGPKPKPKPVVIQVDNGRKKPGPKPKVKLEA